MSTEDDIESLKSEGKRRRFWRWFLIAVITVWLILAVVDLFLTPDPSWLDFVRDRTDTLVAVGILLWIESRIAVLERSVALLAQRRSL